MLSVQSMVFWKTSETTAASIKPLYTVKFDLSEVSTCHDQDSIWVDVHEEWLSEVRQDS